MSSIVPPPPNKNNFAGMVGAKRRRMRSGGNVSTLSNNNLPNKGGAGGSPPPPSAMKHMMMDDDDEKTAQTSKCKGATTIPIFLKKTYKMIESCPTDICSWTPDGEMFVVKDPDRFASEIIPQYFDHNKFSSFARQLNFYGFRKMQSKPIRNSDFDANTAKHVTFYNENFKRGRCDLLKKIQRSTRGGGSASNQDQAKEVQDLKDKVATLEQSVQDMHTQHEERMRRLELDMLGRMEQMMLAMQQQQQTQQQLQLQSQSSTAGSAPVAADALKGLKGNLANGGNTNLNGNANSSNNNGDLPHTFDPFPLGSAGRGVSMGSIGGLASLMGGHQASIGMKNGMTGVTQGVGGPTLPPHPKMKQLPMQNLPGSLSLPPGRLDSLRGISTLSRGLSNLSRGLSTESQGSAMLGNAFEDKFFSMLMNGGAGGGAGVGDPSKAGNNFMNPTPIMMNGAQGGQQQTNSVGMQANTR